MGFIKSFGQRYYSMIIKNIGIYMLGSVLMKGSSCMVMPFCLHYLSPAQLGLFSLSTSFIAIVSVLIGCGLRQALWLEYFHQTTDQRKIIINDIIVLYTVLAVPLCFLLYLLSNSINFYIFNAQAASIMMPLLLFYCFVTFFSELLIQVCTYRQEALKVNMLQCSAAFVTLSGYGIVILYFPSVVGLITAGLTAQVYLCCWGIYWYLKKKLYTTMKIRRIPMIARSYLVLGMPFIPSVLSGWLLASSNRWLLACYCSLEQVGMYSLLDMFNSLFQLFVLTPLAGAYLPHIFEQYVHDKERLLEIDIKNKKLMWYGMASIFSVGIVGFFCLKPLVCKIIPLQYYQVINYAPLLLAGNIFLMGTYFTNCLPQFFKKNWFLSGSLMITALINCISSMFLIRHYHLAGGVYALLIAYASYFILCYWYNNFLHKNKRRYSRAFSNHRESFM